MNYIFDYYFSDKFINGFDAGKFGDNSLDTNLDAKNIFAKSLEKYKEKKSIGVWHHPNEMTSKNTKFFSTYEVFDDNNIIKEKYKDKNFFYKIDLFGAPEWSFPDENDSKETVIDFS